MFTNELYHTLRDEASVAKSKVITYPTREDMGLPKVAESRDNNYGKKKNEEGAV